MLTRDNSIPLEAQMIKKENVNVDTSLKSRRGIVSAQTLAVSSHLVKAVVPSEQDQKMCQILITTKA